MLLNIWSCLKLHLLGSILVVSTHFRWTLMSQCATTPGKKLSLLTAKLLWVQPCNRFGYLAKTPSSVLTCIPAEDGVVLPTTHLSLVVLNLDYKGRKVLLAAPHRLCLYGLPAFLSHMFVHLRESFKWSLKPQHTIPSAQISPSSSQLCNSSCCCPGSTHRYSELRHSTAPEVYAHSLQRGILLRAQGATIQCVWQCRWLITGTPLGL